MVLSAMAFSRIRAISFLLLFSLSAAQFNNDTNTLIQFRSQTDTHANLLANWSSGDACTTAWQGVKCINGRVAFLVLPSLDLRGSIDSLAKLDQLRVLDLHNNRLYGSVRPITNCSNLKLLYLSRNDFSGDVPSEIGSLNRLLRLDISDNNLKGPIPDGFSKLTRLITVRLQNNILSGQVLDLFSALPQLKELNLSNNQLYGQVPEDLQKKFGVRSFDGNAGLCGTTPLPVCSSMSPPIPDQSVVPSNPSSLPTKNDDRVKGESRKGMSNAAIVGIVVGNAVVLLVLTSCVAAYFCRRYTREMREKKSRQSSCSSEKKVYAGVNGNGESDPDRSKLVFFDRRKQFELEDLLRASAEMLGKGGLGTVYKAELENGSIIAVKRLKDANPCSKREFEQYMDMIGKLRHPNIVRLRAYYYAKEEKLLVFDYLPNGSLFSLLHGNRGPGRIPLDWTTRISLVLGAARGLAQIHQEYNALKIPHGNVRSSNVLLDKNGVACISDFGLSLLLNPVHATARLGGYRAPEQAKIKKLSPQADVYSFGVLILEVVTGRAPLQYSSSARNRDGQDLDVDLPRWVRSVVKEEWTAEVFDPELLRYKNIEEELVAMLHVGLACVAEQVDNRPKMSEVVKMIEDIRVEKSQVGEDMDGNRISVSPSLATTATTATEDA
ncbi:hypothetical protein MKW94_006750 [Papaver nudicaule]|uniref:Protein kinase domain-containing protein n=1 Tax=Papaver nudicaule TaxID=74823 RepID=A0AA41VY76_PAPNU|nr:hypothetical protein [Papaver nudicaule]